MRAGHDGVVVGGGRLLRMTGAGVLAAFAWACSSGLSTPAPPVPEQVVGRVALGANLYQQHCASCHRADLSGDPNWKAPNPDGSYPPPPQDSSGHTWHHSDQVLLEIIRDGSAFPQSRMPTFGDTLTDDDILAIIDYFKAEWGPEQREYQRQVTEQETQPQE